MIGFNPRSRDGSDRVTVKPQSVNRFQWCFREPGFLICQRAVFSQFSTSVYLGFAEAHSNDERTVRVVGFLLSEMLNATLPVSPQVVDPYGIFLWFHNFAQLVFQFYEFSWVDLAFENRVLYALSIIKADFCNLSQAFAPGRTCGGNVVGY